MSKFRASNGARVWINRKGVICAEYFQGSDKVWTQAIREFFQYERDQETPYSVVEGEYTIARFFERELAEKFVKKMGHEFMRILPDEPKPWHDAQPGEVWVLTTTGVDSRYETTAFTVEYELKRDYTKFIPVEPDYSVSHLGVNATLITEGYRVWPEDSNDS